MRWSRSLVYAVGIAAAWVVGAATVLSATKNLPSGNAGLTLLGLVGAVVFLGALAVARKWERVLVGDGTEGNAWTGVVSVASGVSYSVVPLALDAGDEVYGGIAELKSRLIHTVLRSKKSQQAARKGKPAPSLKDWTGTSDSNWAAQPAPTSEVYYLQLEPAGDDSSGREIQLVLRKKQGKG